MDPLPYSLSQKGNEVGQGAAAHPCVAEILRWGRGNSRWLVCRGPKMFTRKFTLSVKKVRSYCKEMGGTPSTYSWRKKGLYHSLLKGDHHPLCIEQSSFVPSSTHQTERGKRLPHS